MPVNQSENMPAPGFTKPAHQWGVQVGDEFSAPLDYELLAGTARFQQIGITVLGGQTAGAYGVTSDQRIMVGTVMGRVTASKKYVPYRSSNGDGSQVPVGILRHTVDVSGPDVLANVVTSGILRASLLSGAATTDTYIFGGLAGNAANFVGLNGRIDQVNDQFVF